MKTRKNELDVDFIGGTGPLTKEEEKRISEVIKMLKSKKGSTRKPTRKLTTKKKVTA
jgi:hypothetical protein